MEDSWKPRIGSSVRAKLPNKSKRKHRAIVADVDNDQILVLWEDVSSQFTNILQESWCSRYEIEPLADFEKPEKPFEGDFAENKTRGDQLLSLGDAAAAIRFYESALESIRLQIGCTILLEETSKKSFVFRRAEVDCIEADGAIDVTTLPSNLEKTITANQVALVILESDEEYLQVRMLLNCARCCLQLAELSATIKSYFTERAVLFCSLCIMLLDCAEEGSVSSYLQTALLLKSQALAEKHQYDAALRDLSKLFQLNPDHEIGQRRIKLYKRRKAEMKQNEKKLVKAMCGYIQQATNGVSSESKDRIETEEAPTRVQNTKQGSLWIVILITVFFAWLLQKNL